MNIYLNSQQDAMEFVSLVSGIPYEADLKYGNCMVDANQFLEYWVWQSVKRLR